MFQVPAFRGGLEKVDSRHQAVDPVQAAVEEARYAAAGFTKGPFEQRVLTADDHLGPRVEALDILGCFHMAADPGFDQRPGKKQLSGDAADRNGVLADQFIDLALLGPQELGDFLGGQEFHRVLPAGQRIKRKPTGKKPW